MCLSASSPGYRVTFAWIQRSPARTAPHPAPNAQHAAAARGLAMPGAAAWAGCMAGCLGGRRLRTGSGWQLGAPVANRGLCGTIRFRGGVMVLSTTPDVTGAGE